MVLPFLNYACMSKESTTTKPLLVFHGIKITIVAMERSFTGVPKYACLICYPISVETGSYF